MNVEIGAEAALIPEKEYINGIAVSVYCGKTGILYNFASLFVQRNMMKLRPNMLINKFKKHQSLTWVVLRRG
jgi:hypothetical protein